MVGLKLVCYYLECCETQLFGKIWIIFHKTMFALVIFLWMYIRGDVRACGTHTYMLAGVGTSSCVLTCACALAGKRTTSQNFLPWMAGEVILTLWHMWGFGFNFYKRRTCQESWSSTRSLPLTVTTRSVMLIPITSAAVIRITHDWCY